MQIKPHSVITVHDKKAVRNTYDEVAVEHALVFVEQIDLWVAVTQTCVFTLVLGLSFHTLEEYKCVGVNIPHSQHSLRQHFKTCVLVLI